MSTEENIDTPSSRCRICLSSVDFQLFVNIFEKSPNYANMLSSIADVKLALNDGLPSKICPNCCKHLKSAYRLKLTAERTDKLLQKSFQGNTRKKFIFDTITDIKSKLNDLNVKKEWNVKVEPKPSDNMVIANTVIRKVEKTEPSKIEISDDDDDNCGVEDNDKDSDPSDDEKPLSTIKINKLNPIKIAPLPSDVTINPKTKKLLSSQNTIKTKKVKLTNQNKDTLKKFLSNKNIKIQKLKLTQLNSSQTQKLTKQNNSDKSKKDNLKMCKMNSSALNKKYKDEMFHITHRTTVKMNLPKTNPAKLKEKQEKKNSNSSLGPLKMNIGSGIIVKQLNSNNLSLNKPLKVKMGSGLKVKSLNMGASRIKQKMVCSICGQQTYMLDKHMIVHEEKKFKCQYCPKEFHYEPSLTSHVRIHTGEKQFVCHQCGEAFRSKRVLQMHINSHKTGKPYHCERCDKSFLQKMTLRNHMDMHDGIKRHVCAVCGVAFRRSHHLKCHMIVHTGERAYKCLICNIDFPYKVNLNNHVLSNHGVNLKGKYIHIFSAETYELEMQRLQNEQIKIIEEQMKTSNEHA